MRNRGKRMQFPIYHRGLAAMACFISSGDTNSTTLSHLTRGPSFLKYLPLSKVKHSLTRGQWMRWSRYAATAFSVSAESNMSDGTSRQSARALSTLLACSATTHATAASRSRCFSCMTRVRMLCMTSPAAYSFRYDSKSYGVFVRSRDE